MIRWFLFLAVTGASLMGADFVIGLFAASEVRGPDAAWHGIHLLVSLLTVLALLGIHSIVYAYFMTTEKWTKEVVRGYRLSEGYNTQAKKNKERAIRFVMGSITMIAMAACVGAATDSRGGVHSLWHLGVAAAAFAYNLGALFVEYLAIASHSRILTQLKDQADRQQAERHDPDVIDEENGLAQDNTSLVTANPRA